MSGEFQALEEEWATAVARGDVAAAADLLADDFVLTSVGGVSSRMPRTQWLEALPAIETRRLDVSVDEAREYADVAVVKALLTWEATMGERDLTGRYAVTDVFTRDGGRWRPAWRVSVRLGEPA